MACRDALKTNMSLIGRMRTLTNILIAAAAVLFAVILYDSVYNRHREYFGMAPGVMDQLESTESFGTSPGTLVQLTASHVPTDEDVRAFAINRAQVRKDLIDMTGSP